MRRSALIVLVSATLAGMSSGAMAQSPEIDVYVGGEPAYGSTYYSGPPIVYQSRPAYRAPAYDYRRRYRAPDESVVIRDDPVIAGHCGTYLFWDGDRCRDARNR